MTLEPIATFRSPLSEKFGLPRQSGLAPSLEGEIVFLPEYCDPSFVRGLEGFDRIWIIWSFSANHPSDKPSRPTVRPPRLGGNVQMGVFATRSPQRPNPIGLSCVKVEEVESGKGKLSIRVSGADLMDGTPVYDIKPYIPYCDSFPDARGGFVQEHEWVTLGVDSDGAGILKKHFPGKDCEAIVQLLSQDPRPQYHSDPQRVYGMAFGGKNIRFRVEDGKVYITEVR